ncbi:hypothetical protein ACP3V3_02035 [Vibrio sp. PNB22_3_1]
MTLMEMLLLPITALFGNTDLLSNWIVEPVATIMVTGNLTVSMIVKFLALTLCLWAGTHAMRKVGQHNRAVDGLNMKLGTNNGMPSSPLFYLLDCLKNKK